MASPQGLLSPLERQTYESFGIAPREDRLSLLPRYSAKTGLVAPQFVYDAAKALAAPYTAAQGYDLPPQEAVNVGMNMMGGGSVGTAPKGALRTFIGRNAKTWDKAAETKFLELEKSGVSPEDAWKQTGTFRSPDNKLRQEISDSSAILKGTGSYGNVVMNRLDALQRTGAKNIDSPMNISDIYYHPELLKAYPDLGNIEAQFTPPNVTAKGQFGGNTLRMQYDLPQDKSKSVMLHELQHAIQDKEGFAKGGSHEQFPSNQEVTDAQIIQNLISKGNKPSEAIKWIRENLGRSPSSQAINLGMKENVNLYEIPSANEQYRRLAGEAEARATQARMNMTPEQRAQTFPLKSYDVPKEKLIIKGLLQ